MIPGAGSTDTPSDGKVTHGRHAAAVADGHDRHAASADGHGHRHAGAGVDGHRHGQHAAAGVDGHDHGQQAAAVADGNGHHPADGAHGRHAAGAAEEEPVAGNR
jgi:hypothetical protein